MNIQLDMTTSEKSQQLPTPDFFLVTAHQYSKPSTAADGVSFPALPIFKKFATTGVIALSTVAVGNEAVDLAEFQSFEFHFAFHALPDAVPAAELYARLKEEIVASGVPLLNDDELRAEIRERKGVKSEQDA